MPTEEDIRAAFRELASQAPASGTVLATVRARHQPPSRLSRGTDRIPRLWAGQGRRPGWRRLAAPLAAAIAVVAVAGTSIAVWGGGQASRPSARSASLLDSLPRYYMMLMPTGPGQGWLSYAVIRDTLTGATVATVRPPAPFNGFGRIAAAANDRTFVLEAGDSHLTPSPTQWYAVHFDAASRSFRLTPLPVPEFPVTQSVAGVAVSPDGTELAVAVTTYNTIGTYARVTHQQIRIYSLAGDRAAARQRPIKVWNGPTKPFGFMPTTLLSWARTGVLAFNWWESGNATVRLLRTDSRGGSLLGDSRVAVTSRVASLPTYGKLSTALVLTQGILTSDGGTIAVGGVQGYTAKFMEFSAQTGQLTRIVWSLTRKDNPSWAGPFICSTCLAWANSSGSVLAAWVPSATNTNPLRPRPVFAAVAGGRFVPIPGAPSYPSVVVF